MNWCRPRSLRPCPTALPELAHGMGHPTSELASQFDQILNLSETFAPLLPLDAAVTFYAPLDYTLSDLRGAAVSFSRDTAAVWLRDDGQYFLLPSNQERFENRRLLMEPAITNKCTNWNANPDAALTGLNTFGDAAGVLSRQNDASALLGAGLSQVCVDGNAIEVNNSAGTGNFGLIVDGTAGNVNTHVCNAFARKLSGTVNPFIRLGSGGPTVDITNAVYERLATSAAAASIGDRFYLVCPAGSVARFVLNQLEELPNPSSPIITQGASASRAIDTLRYLDSPSYFSQTAGMLLLRWRPRVASAGLSTSNRALITLNQSTVALTYYDKFQFKAYDGTTEGGVNHGGFVPGDDFRVALRWGGSVFQIGMSKNGGAWVWDAERAYDGAWPTEAANLYVLWGIIDPAQISELTIYDEDRGAAWIEDNY